MSDNWGPGGSGDEHGEPRQPPEPPPPPPPPGHAADQTPVEPVLTLDSETEVTKPGGVGGRVAAGIVGALLLVGGTVFAISQLGSAGPESPEDAVAELLDAASNEDVLGLLAALDPGERDTLRGPVEDLFEQLERLEVLDESFALDGVDGIDLAFDGVTYRTEPVRDDLARVYLTGGTVTGSIKSDEIPIGDFVSDTLDRFDVDFRGVEESETSDIAEEDTFLVARNGSDGWRVSIGYTAAEAARLDAAMALPAKGIEPIGADSPEDAVRGLFQATADLDLRSVIARLSPNEFRALQDYAPIFIDDAADEMAAASQDVEITLDDLSLSSDTSGDRASVFIEGFAITVTSDGSTTSVSYSDECFSVEGDLYELGLDGTPFAEGPVCVDDMGELMSSFYGPTAMGTGEDFDVELPTFPTVESAQIGITTAKVDGQWFVAPIATGMDAMVAGLEVLERSHLDAMVDFVEEMMTAFEESFSYSEEAFAEIGDELGEDLYDPELYDPDFEGSEDVFPTTSILGGSTGTVDEAALEEFVRAYAGDPDLADCILYELSFADDYIRFELADAYAYDYEPSVEAQDVFFTAHDVCASG